MNGSAHKYNIACVQLKDTTYNNASRIKDIYFLLNPEKVHFMLHAKLCSTVRLVIHSHSSKYISIDADDASTENI